MTIEALKPVLLVLIVGVFGNLLQSIPEGSRLPAGFSVSAYFDQLVSECQENHEGWNQQTCERVIRGEVWVGMTDAMIRASIGEPDVIDQPRAGDPSYETWTYRTASYGEEVLRFENGVLLDLSSIKSCTACDAKPLRPVGKE